MKPERRGRHSKKASQARGPHPNDNAPLPLPQVLFSGHLSSCALDEVIFSQPVILRVMQVVPNGEHGNGELLPEFVGETQAGVFHIEAYCKDITDPSKNYFDQLILPGQVAGGAMQPAVCPIMTDHIVIRGEYARVSIVLYGYVLPPSAAAPTTVDSAIQEVRREPAKQPAQQRPPLGPPPPPPPPLQGPLGPPDGGRPQKMQKTEVATIAKPPQPPLHQPPPAALAAALEPPPLSSTQIPASATPHITAMEPALAPPVIPSKSPSSEIAMPVPVASSLWKPPPVPILPPSMKGEPPVVASSKKQAGAAFAAAEATGAEVAPLFQGPALASLPQPTKLLHQMQTTDPFSADFLLPAGVVETISAESESLRQTAACAGVGPALVSAARSLASSLYSCCTGAEGGSMRRRGDGKRVASSEGFTSTVASYLAEGALAALRPYFCGSAGITEESAVVSARAGLVLTEMLLVAPSLAQAFAAAGGISVLNAALRHRSAPSSLLCLAVGALCNACHHEALLKEIVGKGGCYEACVGLVAEADGSEKLHGRKVNPQFLAKLRLVTGAVAVLECMSGASTAAMECGLAAVGEPPAEALSGVDKIEQISKSVIGHYYPAPEAKPASTTEEEVRIPLPPWEESSKPSIPAKALLDLANYISAVGAVIAMPCLPRKPCSFLAPVSALRPLESRTLDNSAGNLLDEAIDSSTAGVSGGNPFSLAFLRLLRRHNVVAALATGAACAERAGLSASRCAAAGTEATALSSAALVLFTAVRTLSLTLLKGGGDPMVGALVFASAPAATAVLVSALSGSAAPGEAREEGVLPLDALEDGMDEEFVTPPLLGGLLTSAVHALAASELALGAAGEVEPGEESLSGACLRSLAQLGARSEAGCGAAANALGSSKLLILSLLAARVAASGAATATILISGQLLGSDSVTAGRALLRHWTGLFDFVCFQARNPSPVADWGSQELAVRLLEMRDVMVELNGAGTTPRGLLSSIQSNTRALEIAFLGHTGDDSNTIRTDNEGALRSELGRLIHAAKPLTALMLALRMLSALSSSSSRIVYALHSEDAVQSVVAALRILTYLIARIWSPAMARRFRLSRSVAPGVSALVDAIKAALLNRTKPPETGDSAVSAVSTNDVPSDPMDVSGGGSGENEITSTAKKSKSVQPRSSKPWTGDAAIADLSNPSPDIVESVEVAMWKELHAVEKGLTPLPSAAERATLHARHSTTALFAAVAGLRLLHDLLVGPVASGAAPYAVCPAPVLSSLLDAQAAISHFPFPTRSSDVGSGRPSPPVSQGGALALRCEALIAKCLKLWLPHGRKEQQAVVSTSSEVIATAEEEPVAHTHDNADADAHESEKDEMVVDEELKKQSNPKPKQITPASRIIGRLCSHALAAPAHLVGGARMLLMLLPPPPPISLHQLPPGVPDAIELLLRVRAATSIEDSKGQRRWASAQLEKRLAWYLRCWDHALAGACTSGGETDSSASMKDEGWEHAQIPRGAHDVVMALVRSSSPLLSAAGASIVARVAGVGALSGESVASALVAGIKRAVEAYLVRAQTHSQQASAIEDGGEGSWQATCRLLAAVRDIAAAGGAGRVALIEGGVLDALLPCLGLPRQEPIRAALDALRPFCQGSGPIGELLKHTSQGFQLSSLATAVRNTVAKWHRVDLHVHAGGAQLLTALASCPASAVYVLTELRPRGAEAVSQAAEGKTTMLLPRLYVGLVKGLEDTQAKYKNRLSAVAGATASDIKRAEELDLKLLLVARAACWATLAPLTLITEGLVDAAELNGVIAPLGTPREHEPVNMLRAAAESIGAVFNEIAPLLESRFSDPTSPAALNLFATRQYLTVLVGVSSRLWEACEAVRGAHGGGTELPLPQPERPLSAVSPLMEWYLYRQLLKADGYITPEMRAAASMLSSLGIGQECAGCVLGDQRLTRMLALKSEPALTPLVSAWASAEDMTSANNTHLTALWEAVKGARNVPQLQSQAWRHKRQRQGTQPSTMSSMSAPTSVRPPSDNTSARSSRIDQQQPTTAVNTQASSTSVPKPSDPRAVKADPRKGSIPDPRAASKDPRANKLDPRKKK